jgi:hypothetical protein
MWAGEAVKAVAAEVSDSILLMRRRSLHRSNGGQTCAEAQGLRAICAAQVQARVDRAAMPQADEAQGRAQAAAHDKKRDLRQKRPRIFHNL